MEEELLAILIFVFVVASAILILILWIRFLSDLIAMNRKKKQVKNGNR